MSCRHRKSCKVRRCPRTPNLPDQENRHALVFQFQYRAPPPLLISPTLVNKSIGMTPPLPSPPLCYARSRHQTRQGHVMKPPVPLAHRTTTRHTNARQGYRRTLYVKPVSMRSVTTEWLGCEVLNPLRCWNLSHVNNILV